MWVRGSEFVLCVGTFGVGFGGVCMCCVWESLGLFFRIEFVLRVVEIVVGVGKWVCVVCGTVWCGFGGASIFCVWDSLCGSGGVSLCCVWDCLVWV